MRALGGLPCETGTLCRVAYRDPVLCDGTGSFVFTAPPGVQLQTPAFLSRLRS